MKSGRSNLLIILSSILIACLFFDSGSAGEAGVGVLNVSPQYNTIRLKQQENFFRIYLTVSDYNSWEDIYSVSIILYENDIQKTQFIFQQYTNNISYNKTNEFSETPSDNNYLELKKCSYHQSNGTTVDEKCYLDLLFVFRQTWFSQIIILAFDRQGANATIQLEYTAADIVRAGNILIIPGIDRPFRFEIPPFLLEIIAIIIAIVGTWYLIKKKDIKKIMSILYEKT